MLDSSPGSVPAGDPSVHIRNPLPTVLGQLDTVVQESDDPTPQLWRVGLGELLLPAPNPQSLFSRGRGAGRGDSCADDAPPPRAPRTRAPRSPHEGLGADPDTRADGLGGLVGIIRSEPG